MYIDVKSIDGSIEVSNLALGTLRFPYRPRMREFIRMLDKYIENGGNCIDTARLYLDGLCEETLGKAIEEYGKRDEIILSTKGGNALWPTPDVKRLSAKNIVLDLDQSLKALQTDYIDLYWVHQDDESIEVEEIIDILNKMSKSGKIRSFGCSNWKSHRIEQANQYANDSGQLGFSASQIGWSAAKPNFTSTGNDVYMTKVEYEWYREKQMPVFAYRSLASGYFHKLNNGILGELDEYIFDNAHNREVCTILNDITERYSCTLNEVLLSYVTNNQIPTVGIVGCKSLNQLNDIIKSLNKRIPFDSFELIKK